VRNCLWRGCGEAVVALVCFLTSGCLARWRVVSQSLVSLVLEACRICVRVVEVELLLESVLEIRLLVMNPESGWSYFDSVVAIVPVLVCETLVVAEVVFSSVG
jgi:hypothetical protein